MAMKSSRNASLISSLSEGNSCVHTGRPSFSSTALCVSAKSPIWYPVNADTTTACSDVSFFIIQICEQLIATNLALLGGRTLAVRLKVRHELSLHLDDLIVYLDLLFVVERTRVMDF